jgi:hypothetical protein
MRRMMRKIDDVTMIMMVELGANVNLCSSEGRSALHWACTRNMPLAVSIYIDESMSMDGSINTELHHTYIFIYM